MLDPAVINVDFLVNQLLKSKSPDALLAKLSTHNTVHIPARTFSKYLFCNGQGLPLPTVDAEERTILRREIDRATERLVNWANIEKAPKCTNTLVPQLNLLRIKEKHCQRVSVEKSPKQDSEPLETERSYVTAVDYSDEEDVQSVVGKRKAVPSCQYSESPQLSKTYKPLVRQPEPEASNTQPTVLDCVEQDGDNTAVENADESDEKADYVGETSFASVQDVANRTEAPIIATSSLSLTLERSPPSSQQVLKHLEALEAVIELDMTLNSKPGSSAKRRLNLESPPKSPSDTRRPLNLNLSGKVGTRRLPEPTTLDPAREATSPRESTSSSTDSSRKSISFYVEVEQPMSPSRRSPMSPSRALLSPTRKSPRSAIRSFERSKSAPVLKTPESAAPRRIRTESYNTSSEVLEQRASKITALVRGYLTRALMRSYKVQQHIQTIRDTTAILTGYQGEMGVHDRAFYNRLKETLAQTKEKIHAIFYELTTTEQMALIANTRAAKRDRYAKELQGVIPVGGGRRKVPKRAKQKAWI